MPKEMYKTPDLIGYRQMVYSTYCAMYHPWIQVFDRSSNKSDYIPPSGAVMGVYSRTDIDRGVHKAPANEVVFCTGLSVNYTKDEQDILNPEGINLIRALPGQGIRIWGARTASSNSALSMLTFEDSLSSLRRASRLIPTGLYLSLMILPSGRELISRSPTSLMDFGETE